MKKLFLIGLIFIGLTANGQVENLNKSDIANIGVGGRFFSSESLSFYQLEDDTFDILPSDKVIKISLLPATGDSVYVRGRVKVIDGKTSEEVLFLDDIAITLGVLLAPIDTLRFRNRGVVKYIVEW
jgi:hypothetical protein